MDPVRLNVDDMTAMHITIGHGPEGWIVDASALGHGSMLVDANPEHIAGIVRGMVAAYLLKVEKILDDDKKGGDVMGDDNGDWLKKYHAEHAGYGGASHEFHARAQTWIATRAAEIERLKAEVERHLRCTSSYPEKQAACARKDDEIARLRDIIVELERWKSAAQLAWSICVETAPEDCPGPDAVRAEVDALDDRCIAAEGQVLVAATLAPKDPPPGVVVSDLARRFNRAMGRQEWSADGVRAAAVVERALAAGPARIRDNYPLSDHWAADVVEAAQEAAMKVKP